MKTMNGDGKFKAGQPVSRQIMFVVLGSACVLLVPLLAMQFTNEVDWDLFDFAVMGALLVGTGVTYVLLARMVSNGQQRLMLGLGLAVAFFLIWAELAVGVFGTPIAGS